MVAVYPAVASLNILRFRERRYAAGQRRNVNAPLAAMPRSILLASTPMVVHDREVGEPSLVLPDFSPDSDSPGHQPRVPGVAKFVGLSCESRRAL